MRKGKMWRRVLCAWLVGCWLAGTALAAGPGNGAGPVAKMRSQRPQRVLTVGMAVAPPFIQKDNQGQFGGISYDLWRDVAQDLGLTWKAVEYDLPGLLAAVRDGAVDVGVSDLSITPGREAVMDFSQPFYSTGLGIAVPASVKGAIVPALLHRVFSLRVFLYAGSLLALLLVVGTVEWLIEHRRNPQFFKRGLRGIGDGLWWSAVTMTAVGYGDTTPKTPFGRIVALVWMFASIMLLAFFTAGITSSLTVETLGERVHSFGDLYKVRVGVKSGASAEEALYASHIWPATFPDVESGLEALAKGAIDAFVHDQPDLRYMQHHFFPSQVRVLSVTFDPQLYGFAFPPKSDLRKSVNIAMLRRLEDREYRNRLFGGYLGTTRAY